MSSSKFGKIIENTYLNLLLEDVKCYVARYAAPVCQPLLAPLKV